LIYSAHINTVKGTYTKIAPKRTVLSVTKGLVYKLELFFPPGSEGELGVVITDGGYQVWPSSPGQWFTGDDELIGFDDMYLKSTAPYQFDIYTYNDDASYDHIVDVRIGLVSKRLYQARFLPNLAWEDFVGMMESLAEEQRIKAENVKAGIIETPFEWLKK